jgi:hypothetical protein
MDLTSSLDRCETLQDIQRQSGKRAIVVGVYREIDIRMRRKTIPKYSGHAAIQLEDDVEILLEPSWSEAAIRSKEERQQFRGKKVEALGIVYVESPEPPISMAYVMGPCISPVEAIHLHRE